MAPLRYYVSALLIHSFRLFQVLQQAICYVDHYVSRRKVRQVQRAQREIGRRLSKYSLVTPSVEEESALHSPVTASGYEWLLRHSYQVEHLCHHYHYQE